MSRKMSLLFIAFAIAIFILSTPSSRTTAASTGGLDAAIVGSAEFIPGATTIVQVSIQNNKTVAEIDALAIQAGLSEYYGSAVGLTASLKKNDTPITIKTDKVLLGTIPSGVATPPVPFIIEVDEYATSGLYQIGLELTYKELSDIEMGEKVNLKWVNRTEIKELEIEIKEDPLRFEVTNIEATLQPGVRKELMLTFKNHGHQTAQASVVKISADDPISLTDDTAFLGDLGPGDTAVGIFELKVDGDAIPKEYALTAQIKYTDNQGNEYISKVPKVPIEVSPGYSLSEMISTHVVSGLAGAGIVAAIWIIWFFGFRRKPLFTN